MLELLRSLLLPRRSRRPNKICWGQWGPSVVSACEISIRHEYYISYLVLTKASGAEVYIDAVTTVECLTDAPSSMALPPGLQPPLDNFHVAMVEPWVPYYVCHANCSFALVAVEEGCCGARFVQFQRSGVRHGLCG